MRVKTVTGRLAISVLAIAMFLYAYYNFSVGFYLVGFMLGASSVFIWQETENDE